MRRVAQAPRAKDPTIEEIKIKISAKANELSAIENIITEKTSEIVSYEKELADLNSLLEQAKKLEHETNNRQEVANKKLIDTQNEIEPLERQKRDLISAINELNTNFSTTSREYSKKNKELEERFVARKEELEAILLNLDNGIKQSNDILAGVNNNYTAISKKYTALTKELAILEDNKSNIETEIIQLKQILLVNQDKAEKSLEKVTKIDQELQEKTKELLELCRQSEIKQNELLDLNDKIVEAKTSIILLQDKEAILNLKEKELKEKYAKVGLEY